MRRLGEAFQAATCRNCRRPIVHVWWGNGGTIWEHEDTGLTDCHTAPVAEPGDDLRDLIARSKS